MGPNLVEIALYGIFIVIGIAAGLLIAIDKRSDTDIETRRIRFGAAILTGILLLFLLVTVMYFSAPDDNGAAAVIFDKTLTALTPIVGVLIAYFFSPKS